MQAFIFLTRSLLLQALRNRIALVYGFVFPLLFLLGFHAIYAQDPVPLALHAGQFLTVTVLGSACFGLPTSLVAERELGTWRLYALAPVSRAVLVAAVLVARILLLAAALVLQLGLALALGMPLPADPTGMAAGLAVVSVAFLGLGATMAMLVTSVPAVQAVGQALFLPMLMIGGVAVPLTSIPDWAVPLSHALPGRAAVTVLQASQVGGGLSALGPELFVLLLNGAAGFVVAVLMFRWEPALPGQRLRRPWALLLLASLWLAAASGLGDAGRERPVAVDVESAGQASDYLRQPPPTLARTASEVGAASPADSPAPRVASRPAPAAGSPAPAVPRDPPLPAWRGVTTAELEDVAYDRLPPDSGLVAPFAADAELLDPLVESLLARVALNLPGWAPAQEPDLEQRLRNLLFVAAVPDVLQVEGFERGMPRLLLQVLRRDVPAADLPLVLYWIATHPADGDDAAIGQLAELGLPALDAPTPAEREQYRGRVMLYAFKLLGRVTGNLPVAGQRTE